jgi:hypothetical protein
MRNSVQLLMPLRVLLPMLLCCRHRPAMTLPSSVVLSGVSVALCDGQGRSSSLTTLCCLFQNWYIDGSTSM